MGNIYMTCWTLFDRLVCIAREDRTYLGEFASPIATDWPLFPNTPGPWGLSFCGFQGCEGRPKIQ